MHKSKLQINFYKENRMVYHSRPEVPVDVTDASKLAEAAKKAAETSKPKIDPKVKAAVEQGKAAAIASAEKPHQPPKLP